MASSWLTKRLYEQPLSGSAASTMTAARAAVLRVISISPSQLSEFQIPDSQFQIPILDSPSRSAAAAAGPAAAEAAEPATEPAAAHPAAAPASRPGAAAERPHAARPPAPAAPPPVSPAAGRAASPAHQHDGDEDGDHQRQRNPATGWPPLNPPRHALQLDVAALGDPADDAAGSGDEARPVTAVAELRGDVVAAGFAGKAVGDPLLEAVADLDFDAPLLPHDENQHPVVLGALADPAAAVLEQLDGVITRCRKRRHRVDRGDDDDVARSLLQPPDHRFELLFVGGIEDVGEVVDGRGQLGQRSLGDSPAKAGHDSQDDGDGDERRTPSGERRTAAPPDHAALQRSTYAVSRCTASR